MKINDLKNKYLSLFLSGIITLIMLVSALYMAEEAHHECTGEDCPICECLHLCEGIMYETEAAEGLLIAAAVTVLIAFISRTGAGYILLYDTPVSEKVRMDS